MLLAPLLFADVAGNDAWLRVALDASHAPIFAGVAWLLGVLLRRPASPPGTERSSDAGRYAMVFGIALALGAAIEWIQSLVDDNRPASLFDLGTDAAGAVVGLAVLALSENRRGREPGAAVGRATWTLVGAALLALVFVCWRPAEAGHAYLHRARQFPVLAAFARPIDLYFVDTQGRTAGIVDLPAPWASRVGERALRVRYDAARGPALQVSEPSADWRGYDTLALDVTNPGDRPLSLVLRVLDADHDWSREDRLNLPLTIPPSARRTVRVALEAVRTAPANRPMDLSHIANVMIYGSGGGGEGELYVSRLWLE